MPSDPCPSPPPIPDPKLLGFEPFQKMVRWFTPSELTRAGVKALLSSLFGSYADNRELQAVRASLDIESYAKADELWIDYVADLGDGWDATYSVARLLAEPSLTLDADGSPVETQRGRVLIMGGDQVYPTATREEYTNRLSGPYRAALPCVLPESEAPHLYAVPGNHDWYDGLTSFSRLFCQGRWIGGWKTYQSRSYFALELPHGWWLWGIDVQLGSDVDLPQLRFFQEVAKAKMPPGSKIILCVAEPSWVYTDREGPETYDNLAFFEREAIQRFGHEHVVGLAGDLHAYARYEGPGDKQRFVSGGGGAYLYPSHQLPKALTLPTGSRSEETPVTEHFRLGRPGDHSPGAPAEALFPAAAESQRLALGSLLFPFKNLGFSGVIGVFYLFLVWLVQSASKAVVLPDHFLETLPLDVRQEMPRSFLETLAGRAGLLSFQSLTDAVYHLAQILAHAPLAFFTVLVLGLGLIAFADATGPKKWLLGAIHTAVHVVVLLLLTWAFALVNLGVIGLDVDEIVQATLFAVEMLVLGSLAGGLVMGLYLYITHLLFPGTHTNEVLACQSLPDYKHILRLHIDREGALTIYPIGVREVPRAWDYKPDADPGKAWFEPKGKPMAERAELIEPPVHVRHSEPVHSEGANRPAYPVSS